MKTPDCMINGQMTDLISSTDRGLLYGDGLFETMAVIGGNIPLWERHLQRLQRDSRRLGLCCPSEDDLRAEVEQFTHGVARGIVKVILTRGQGGRGYAPPAAAVPTRIVQRHAWPELPTSLWQTGVKVKLCQLQLAQQPRLAGIKHLNRLEQVLARAELTDTALQEGILADSQGHIIEAVSHNLFLLQGKTFITPDLNQCGVAGVMREYVISHLQEAGLPVQITRVSRQSLLAADALFLCNSIHGIWPICEVDGKPFNLNPLICELREHVARIIPYP